MINSKTLGIMAIFAASVLVTGALTATPSYASVDAHKDKNKDKNKDKDGVSGDGDTNLKFTSVDKPYFSVFYNNVLIFN